MLPDHRLNPQVNAAVRIGCSVPEKSAAQIKNNAMYPYTIDDDIECPLKTSVEVTIAFPTGPRWLFFATPQLLNDVGDTVAGGSARVHLGELHMIVISELNAVTIDAVLRDLHKAGELERRTLAF